MSSSVCMGLSSSKCVLCFTKLVGQCIDLIDLGGQSVNCSGDLFFNSMNFFAIFRAGWGWSFLFGLFISVIQLVFKFLISESQWGNNFNDSNTQIILLVIHSLFCSNSLFLERVEPLVLQLSLCGLLHVLPWLESFRNHKKKENLTFRICPTGTFWCFRWRFLISGWFLVCWRSFRFGWAFFVCAWRGLLCSWGRWRFLGGKLGSVGVRSTIRVHLSGRRLLGFRHLWAK